MRQMTPAIPPIDDAGETLGMLPKLFSVAAAIGAGVMAIFRIGKMMQRIDTAIAKIDAVSKRLDEQMLTKAEFEATKIPALEDHDRYEKELLALHEKDSNHEGRISFLEGRQKVKNI